MRRVKLVRCRQALFDVMQYSYPTLGWSDTFDCHPQNLQEAPEEQVDMLLESLLMPEPQNKQFVDTRTDMCDVVGESVPASPKDVSLAGSAEAVGSSLSQSVVGFSSLLPSHTSGVQECKGERKQSGVGASLSQSVAVSGGLGGVRRSQDPPGAKNDERTAEAPSVGETNRGAVQIWEKRAAESSEAPGGRKREKTQLQYDNPSFVAAPCRGRLWWQARHQIASKWLLESVDAVNLGGGERLGDPCEGNPKPKNLQDKEFHSRDMVSHIVSEEGIAASTDSRVASSKVAGVGVVSGEVGGTILEEDFVSRFPWGPKYSRLESIDEEQAEIAYMSSPSFVALAIRCQEVCFKEGLVTYKEYGAVSQYIGGESARERGEFLLQLADDRRKGGNAEPVDYVDSYGRTRLDMSKGRV